MGDEWDEEFKSDSPEQIRHRTFLTIHDFFVALSKRQPVVLVFKDLHWADSLSLDLISLLMEALPPFTLVYALYFVATLYQFRREGQAVQEQVEALLRISKERGFALYLAWGTSLHGWALADQGSRRRESRRCTGAWLPGGPQG